MRTVAILGCGVIGASWASLFQRAGFAVRAWDPDPSSLSALEARLGDAVHVATSADDAVEGAEFVQESCPEVLNLKQDILQRVAHRLAPDAIFASSTSTLVASELQAGCSFAERVLVGHPFNPPQLSPLVERPGHLANRIQAAVWREAIDAVASGQASVADVDLAMTQALGPRWAIMGPFATFNLAGGAGGLGHFIDHLGAPFEALWDDAQRPVMTPRLVSQLIDGLQSGTGRHSVAELCAERDAKLQTILDLKLANNDGRTP